MRAYKQSTRTKNNTNGSTDGTSGTGEDRRGERRSKFIIGGSRYNTTLMTNSSLSQINHIKIDWEDIHISVTTKVSEKKERQQRVNNKERKVW